MPVEDATRDVATRATLARLLARLSSATPSPRRKRTVTTPRGASGSSCVAVLKRAEGRPVVASCARTMPSSHPNARRDPSGLNAAHCARVDVGQEISHSVAPKSARRRRSGPRRPRRRTRRRRRRSRASGRRRASGRGPRAPSRSGRGCGNPSRSRWCRRRRGRRARNPRRCASGRRSPWRRGEAKTERTRSGGGARVCVRGRRVRGKVPSQRQKSRARRVERRDEHENSPVGCDETHDAWDDARPATPWRRRTSRRRHNAFARSTRRPNARAASPCRFRVPASPRRRPLRGVDR